MKNSTMPRKPRLEGDSRKAENFTTSFIHDGYVCNAHLTNLSESGAHLSVEPDHRIWSSLYLGAELRLAVLTPYGRSQCTAIVKWIESAAAEPSFGVEFSNLSTDPADPLRCAIDSPL